MEGFSPASSSVSNQKQMAIGAECWLSTEQITQEILSAVQPSLVSEQRRMGVIHYVQRLIRSTYGTEVRITFPFGSSCLVFSAFSGCHKSIFCEW